MKVVQVVGYKNAGKTTLAAKMVSRLSAKGLRVGTIKHDAHNAEPDTPGTDTWLHRAAGAKATVLVSESRTMRVQEQTTSLPELIAAYEADGMDVVVVEGFKTAGFPKLVLLRGEQDRDLLELPGILAIVRTDSASSDNPGVESGDYPVFFAGGFAFEPLLDFIERSLWYNDGQEKKSEVH
jgi:molybdopterin-guanine dinucleotide biosynthesis protein B